MTRPLITLTTDFGTSDPFVGVMKGVILSIAPEASIVDVVHTIPPQNVHEGAYVFATAYRYFPAHVVHVVVIDPGVGTERSPIAVTSPLGTFVCPDNGVLSYVLADAGAVLEAAPFTRGRLALPDGWAAFRLTNEKYWVHPLSTTFHGRDIFSPSAAFLSAGVSVRSLGEEIADVEVFAIPKVQRRADEVIGQVLHVDHFGNLITNIAQADLPEGRITVEIHDRTIRGISPNYQTGESLLALVSSSGTLEIAVPNGNAARMLGAAAGTDVRVTASG